MFALWKQRNDELHGDDAEGGGRKRQEAVRRIEALCDLEEHVNASDREIFRTPVDEVLERTTEQLQDWIDAFESTIQTARKDAEEHAKQGTTDIRDVFVRLV